MHKKIKRMLSDYDYEIRIFQTTYILNNIKTDEVNSREGQVNSFLIWT